MLEPTRAQAFSKNPRCAIVASNGAARIFQTPSDFCIEKHRSEEAPFGPGSLLFPLFEMGQLSRNLGVDSWMWADLRQCLGLSHQPTKALNNRRNVFSRIVARATLRD